MAHSRGSRPLQVGHDEQSDRDGKVYVRLDRSPLPGRLNIVLTRQEDWERDGVWVARTPQEALDIAYRERPGRDVCIIGGGEVYKLFMPLAGRLEITAVAADPEGDAHFPQWDSKEWRLVVEEPRQGPPPYSFQTWLPVSGERDS